MILVNIRSAINHLSLPFGLYRKHLDHKKTHNSIENTQLPPNRGGKKPELTYFGSLQLQGLLHSPMAVKNHLLPARAHTNAGSTSGARLNRMLRLTELRCYRTSVISATELVVGLFFEGPQLSISPHSSSLNR